MATREERFVEDVTAFNHEMTVAAVRADFDKVKNAVAATFPEISATPVYSQFDMMAAGLAAYQVAGSEWTVIIYSIGWYSPSGFQNLTEISGSLKADALVYVAEDTSGEEYIQFFRNGDLKATIRSDYESDNSLSKAELEKAFKLSDAELETSSYVKVFENLKVSPLSVGMGENGELLFDADAEDIELKYAAFQSPGFKR